MTKTLQQLRDDTFSDNPVTDILRHLIDALIAEREPPAPAPTRPASAGEDDAPEYERDWRDAATGVRKALGLHPWEGIEAGARRIVGERDELAGKAIGFGAEMLALRTIAEAAEREREEWHTAAKRHLATGDDLRRRVIPAERALAEVTAERDELRAKLEAADAMSEVRMWREKYERTQACIDAAASRAETAEAALAAADAFAASFAQDWSRSTKTIAACDAYRAIRGVR